METPRRARNRSSRKKEDTLPEDLRDFIVGREIPDRMFKPRANDLSDGESDSEVFLTPPVRERLAKEIEDLGITMSTPELSPTKRRDIKRKNYNIDDYYNGSLHGLHDDDDDEEPLMTRPKLERKSEYKLEHESMFKCEEPVLGTQSSPIEILDDDDEEAPPKKGARLNAYSTPVKAEKKVKVERAMSTTPSKFSLRHSNDSPSAQTSSSTVVRFRNPNDTLSPSTIASLKLKAGLVITPLRPQLRQPKVVAGQRTESESPISLKRLRSQTITTPIMIDYSDHIDDEIDFGINLVEDDKLTNPMTINNTEGMPLADTSTTTSIDDGINTSTADKVIAPPPRNDTKPDFATEQVFLLAELAEVQMPPEYHTLLHRSATGLPAFLQLAKSRIKQKLDIIEPVRTRQLLADICDDVVSKEACVVESNDWILLRGLILCDAVKRMVLLENGVPGDSAGLNFDKRRET